MKDSIWTRAEMETVTLFGYLDVIDPNSEELRCIWLFWDVEGLIWILQQWGFSKCWVGFENN